MGPIERTLSAINHRQPDRPPVYVSLTPQVAEKLSETLHLPYEEPFDAMAEFIISSFKRDLCFGVSFFESLRTECLKFFRRITAAATTGPARQPLPASSQPASVRL